MTLKSFDIFNNISEWESFNQANGPSSIYQSTIWAKYLHHEKIPFQAWLILNQKSEKIGQLLHWIEPPSYFWKYHIPKKLLYFCNLITPRICWKDGPVVDLKNLDYQECIIAQCIKKIHENKILSGVCRAELNHNSFLQFAKIRIEKYGTFIVSTDQSEEALWKNLEASARKNIKKKGLVLRLLEPEEAGKYFQLLHEYRKKLKISIPTHAASPALYKIAGQYAFAKQVGAFDQERLVGALGILGYQGKLVETGVARDYGSPLNSIAQAQIKWFIIQNAKKWGFGEFDLAGYDPSDQTEKGKNIRRFKAKWGGTTKVFTHIKKL